MPGGALNLVVKNKFFENWPSGSHTLIKFVGEFPPTFSIFIERFGSNLESGISRQFR